MGNGDGLVFVDSWTDWCQTIVQRTECKMKSEKCKVSIEVRVILYRSLLTFHFVLVLCHRVLREEARHVTEGSRGLNPVVQYTTR